MIKLPSPAGTMTVTYGIDQKVKVPVYDEKQVREYVAAAVAAEREACAKVCDDHERQRCEAWAKVLTTGGEVPSASLSAVAAAIRARGQS